MVPHILHEASRCLKDLHETNVLHSDIKPSNIIVSYQDADKKMESLKFIDFNTSKDMNEASILLWSSIEEKPTYSQ